MYSIERTKSFDKSLRRILRSGISPDILSKIEHTIQLLAEGAKLEKAYKDHQLKGELRQYRECHIKPDLLLIYQREDRDLILILLDIGSHSHLFK